MAKKPRASMLNTLWQPRSKKTRQTPKTRRPQHSFEPLENRNLLAVTSFVDIDGGYSGTQDTVLYSIFANVNFGADTGISVDQQDVAGVRQGLLKFDSIIGNGPGQIPLGSTINSATLTVSVFNDSNAAMQMSMYRMLTDWNQDTATWNSFGAIGGVQASEGEATGLPPDAILFDAATGTKTFNVTTSVSHWASGESNFGWLFETTATNGWDWNTSEAAQGNRPVLTIDYTPPGGAGQFQFLNLAPSQTEGDAGTTIANLQISRIGGTSGAASVDYTIAAGSTNPATAGVDFVGGGPITVNFADGQSVATIPITINGDTDLEGLETISVTLSNATGGATIKPAASTAALTILDDDALINEVLANVSNGVVDETNREYIELEGTPGASLDGYYFVVFEGEEEEGAVGDNGAGSGVADLVIDLSGQTFGSNGLLVITPTAWAFQALMDPATHQMTTPKLDGVGGRIEDSSQTYALVRSPVALVEGFDYDQIGLYTSAAQTATSTDDLNGVKEGLGILDQGPFAPGGGGQLVDSVGVVEGGGNDRDRVLTTREAGHPGVHVHQPDGSGTGNANVASDAVTRRIGQKTPSTIGVWYNGDIPDGAANPIAYRTGFQTDGPDKGKTVSSVVTPPGATLTPGAPNRVRSVFLTETEKTVDENVGTVTLNVTRLDTTEAITVDYTTVDGSAKAGQDFPLTSGQLSFAVGEATKPIVIPITQSVGVPEGFESFLVRISNPTAPSVVTTSAAQITIRDLDVLQKSFQQGDANGYSGTKDTTLNSIQPTDAFGIAGTVLVDEQAGTLTGPDARPAQGLLRFDDLFGAAANQVPVGSQIFGGFVTLFVSNPSDANAAIRFFRMLNNWDEGTATWADPQGSAGAGLVNGVTPDDVESSTQADLVLLPGKDGFVDIPVDQDTLQAWANGTLANYGWSIVSNTANDWSFTSSDALINQPKLTLFYTAPTATQGTFGFSDDAYKVNENSGSATLTVQRVGGSTGAASVDWSIALGTAAAGDISGPTSGTLNFANGELSKTISIPIVNDTSLERNETLSVTLSNATLDPARTTAALTIRDNDFNTSSPTVLLNEILINSPGLDSGQEYAELSGTANSALGSLYFVVINGDVGEGEGSTDFVVDLGAYANGANGITLIKALDNFGFTAPTGATQVSLAALDAEIIANDTATYALVYSPQTSLLVGSYDYDWDNDGSLDLPTGAVIVDSVANADNGATDFTYGPPSNRILSQLHPNVFVADGLSRLRGNTQRNNAAAWFNGDLTTISSTADDQLVYDSINSVGLPVPGAAMTPGEPNTGTAAQSPLVSLTSITPSTAVGTVTLAFSGPVTQFLDQGGFPGVTISDLTGAVVPGVDSLPQVAGLGTNTLTLTFTGSAVVGGQLPAGNYRLNFTGNSLIGNGRAVDAANTATAAGSNFSFQFTQSAVGHAGDYTGDSVVDGADILRWQRQLGNSTPAPVESDGSGNGTVDAADLGVWSAHFGEGAATASAGVLSAGGNGSDIVAKDALFSAGDFSTLFTEARNFRPGRRSRTAI